MNFVVSINARLVKEGSKFLLEVPITAPVVMNKMWQTKNNLYIELYDLKLLKPKKEDENPKDLVWKRLDPFRY